jgi:putative ABC transport system permease protein
MSFILKMAWRDSRRNRARLLLFISAIVMGIAALTAVRSFSENLTKDIDKEAKSLLGADILLDANAELKDSTLAPFAVVGSEQAIVANFLSMVRFPKNGGTRLSMIRSLEGDYPFYGKWKSQPENAWQSFRNGPKALVDHALMLQFGIQPGDSIQIGNTTFIVEGDLLSSTGRAGIASSIAPVVFINTKYLEETGLVQRGSRIDYQYFFKMPDNVDADAIAKPFMRQRQNREERENNERKETQEEKEQRERREKQDFRVETVKARKENIGAAFGNFGIFLNLVGFVALLLGCIGVAGAVHIYIKDKLPTVAIMRCLGASGKKAFYVYLVQVAGIGLIGAIMGALLGSMLQKLLPMVMKDFLPIDNITTDISWSSAGQGILLGLSVAVLFALLPLTGILKTSPLRTLRASFGEKEKVDNGLRWAIYALLTIAIFGFTWSIIKDWKQSLYFMGGVGAAFFILFGIAKVLTFSLKKFFPKKWSFIWRQGIANLFRPENQTVLLVVTVGLGTMLLSTLFLIQNLLLKQVAFSGSGSQPNMILFDIQSDQKDAVAQLVKSNNLPVMQQVPIITTRLETVNGRTKEENSQDSTNSLPNWLWNREFRVTFRDTMIDTEELLEGAWVTEHIPGQKVKVSMAENMVKEMKATIGMPLVFNVQGAMIEAEIASIRKVDFNKVQTNFLFVFPKGVLEKAPQFHVIVSKVASAEQSAKFQSELVQKYPNVSAIDLTQILKSVDEILKKVSFVIRFMAMFSILTGLLVLISSIYQGKYARIRESVLLRTLGASRKQILRINALEYFLLGSLSCLGGLLLSLVGAWTLSKFAFKIPFEPDWLPVLGTFATISGLTVLIGLFNSREVINKPPLEVLRAEV